MHEAPADVVRRAFVGKHAVFPQSCWSPVLRSCAIHSAVQEVAFSNLSRAPATVKCVSFDGNRCSALALEAMEAPKVLAASNYLPGDSAVHTLDAPSSRCSPFFVPTLCSIKLSPVLLTFLGGTCAPPPQGRVWQIAPLSHCLVGWVGFVLPVAVVVGVVMIVVVVVVVVGDRVLSCSLDII